MNCCSLADHGIGRTALETIEQKRPKGKDFGAVLFMRTLHWGLEGKLFSSVRLRGFPRGAFGKVPTWVDPLLAKHRPPFSEQPGP
jgi:hypothetical protein